MLKWYGVGSKHKGDKDDTKTTKISIGALPRLHKHVPCWFEAGRPRISQALFRGAFVSRRRRVSVSGGAWKPAGLARVSFPSASLLAGTGRGRRANRRQAIPGLAGFRGRRGSAQPRIGEDR